MPFKRGCLLGRTVEHCRADPARRGDDELVDRVTDLSPEEIEQVKERLRRDVHNVTADMHVHSKKKDEWG
jgi:hypothetical protein